MNYSGLRDYRRRAGLKQTTLAAESGLTQQAVSSIEGGGWMTAEAARKLAVPLRISESSLRVFHNLYWLEHRSKDATSPRQALRNALRLLTMIEDWNLPMEETKLVAKLYESLLVVASLHAQD